MKSERVTRVMAGLALACSLLALVLAGWAVHMQQQSETRLREIGDELQRGLTPSLPMRAPPLGLDLDDT